MILTIRGWRGAVAAALAIQGCARPCLDDGFLAMQHDRACVAAETGSTGTASGGSTGAESPGSTGSTGACSCTTGAESTSTGAEATSTGAGSTGAGESSGGKFDLGVKQDVGPLCGDGDVEGSEPCDDGNDDDLDACNGWCKPTPVAIDATEAGSLTIEGGAGGSPFADACPAGEVLIGFVGDIDDQGRIGRLSGVCAPLLVLDDGVQFVAMTGPTTDLPIQGMVDLGGPFMSLCGASSAVVGFRGSESMWIDQLVIRCAEITIAESMGDYSLMFGPTVELATAGTNVDGAPFSEQDCPAGQVANAQTGMAGQVIDALGLGCATLALL